MVRNDDFYLKKWVEYYGAQLGKENLYIFFDGKDQKIAPFCDGANCVLHEKIQGRVTSLDKGRSSILSSKAAELFSQGYDMVVGTDADEFLVVDPKLGMTLQEFLSTLNGRTCYSALGLDYGQRIGEEGDYDEHLPFTSQRHYAQLCTRYTKACVISRPCRWGSGFHRVKHENYHIVPDLYLMHFGYFDLKRMQQKLTDKDRLGQGWSGHLSRRARTIRYATRLKALDFDAAVRPARICQNIIRPPYAWNKPAMFELRIVVKIPPRFDDIV